MKKQLLPLLIILLNIIQQTNLHAQALTAHGGGPFAVCAGTPVVIGSNPTATGGTPGYTYSWSPATGLNSTSAANPTATLTNTTTYTLTVMDNAGGSATATTTVNITQPPTVAAAGANQTVCGTTATLAGNVAAVGSSIWTLISGAGTITTPTSPTTGITSIGVGANVFQWTISNAPCTASSSQVTINATPPPTVAAAGANQTVCATATLAANVAATGTGVWTLVSGGGTITTPASPTSGLTNLSLGANVFQWTISNPPCPSSSSQVTIFNTCTGIYEYTDENTISIYPNPSTGVFTIESANSKIESIKVFNLLGEEILTVTPNNHTTIINNQFSKGIYFIQVTYCSTSSPTDNKTVINKKIVIQ